MKIHISSRVDLQDFATAAAHMQEMYPDLKTKGALLQQIILEYVEHLTCDPQHVRQTEEEAHQFVLSLGGTSLITNKENQGKNQYTLKSELKGILDNIENTI